MYLRYLYIIVVGWIEIRKINMNNLSYLNLLVTVKNVIVGSNIVSGLFMKLVPCKISFIVCSLSFTLIPMSVRILKYAVRGVAYVGQSNI